MSENGIILREAQEYHSYLYPQKRSFLPLSAHFEQYPAKDGSMQQALKSISDESIITRFASTASPVKPDDVYCPHFMQLKWGYGCPYDCSWCFLYGTLRLQPDGKKPKTKPRDKILKHLLTAFVQEGPAELFNTGELCDSLMDERKAVPF